MGYRSIQRIESWNSLLIAHSKAKHLSGVLNSFYILVMRQKNDERSIKYDSVFSRLLKECDFFSSYRLQEIFSSMAFSKIYVTHWKEVISTQFMNSMVGESKIENCNQSNNIISGTSFYIYKFGVVRHEKALVSILFLDNFTFLRLLNSKFHYPEIILISCIYEIDFYKYLYSTDYENPVVTKKGVISSFFAI